MMAAFVDAYLSGDIAQAQALDAKLQPIHDILFVESSPTPTKWHFPQYMEIDRRHSLAVAFELTAPNQAELTACCVRSSYNPHVASDLYNSFLHTILQGGIKCTLNAIFRWRDLSLSTSSG